MTLTIGTQLGSHEITGLLGKGGMGEVYRARDLKLNREVAIKIVPGEFAQDTDRVARFEREARVLASLNHPNIAAIYGLENSKEKTFLVMELVPGETLADRIERGPLPVHEASGIARQIAEALEAAHEKGVVHRDLKPANIKVTSDGTVKLLDFGLAKAYDQSSSNATLSNSPTMSIAATNAGVILGTAAYMSPEQALCREVDRRADIWSFGAVLYEMLTGRKAFPGESVSDTLAAVLKVEADWKALPENTPASLRKLTHRCLTKDLKQRLQAIGEARIVLTSPESGMENPAASAAALRTGWLWPCAAAVLAVVAASVSYIHFGERASVPIQVQRFEIPVPRPEIIGGAVSWDGSRLVFFSSGQTGQNGMLFMRALDSLETRPLAGTEGATGLPFWSPDSRYIAFASDGKLRKMDVEGGALQVLCDATVDVGGFWTTDGKIVFSDGHGLVQIPASGGTPSSLPGSGPDTGDSFPVPLWDGRHFVFRRLSQATDATYVGSLEEGVKPKKLVDGIANFAPSTGDPKLGYLLFLRNATAGPASQSIGTLMAQRFDLRRLELIGEPVLINDRVKGIFSVSRTGVLIFARASGEVGDQLTIYDRQGNVLQMLGEPGQYNRVAFSPDGLRVIAGRIGGKANRPQLWMFDLARGLASRFPTDIAGGALFPVWSPDGSRIVFASNRGGKWDLYQRFSNGGGEDELLFKPDEDMLPVTLSRDGRFLGVGSFYAQQQTSFVMTLDSKGQPTGKPRVFVKQGLGIGDEFSPDLSGPPHWIAYESTRDGRTEVYLREFDPNSPTLTPVNAGDWQVSKGGGTSPRWNPNGKELLYLATDRTIMAVDLTGNPKVPTSQAKPVTKPKGIERASQAGSAALSWDVSPDGKKFLFPIPVAAADKTAPITVVLNWPSLLAQ